MKRFRHGLVVGKFYPFHLGHSHLIGAASDECDLVTVEVLASSVESVPAQQRAGWIVATHPTARVVWAMDDAAVDYASDLAWREHMVIITGLLAGQPPVDAVFTSDEYGAELARRLDATWVQIDPGRRTNPISGRAIRAHLEGMWWALPEAVQHDLAGWRHGSRSFSDPLPEAGTSPTVDVKHT